MSTRIGARQLATLHFITTQRGPGGVLMRTLTRGGIRRDMVDRLCTLGLVRVEARHPTTRAHDRYDITDAGTRHLATTGAR